MVMAWPTAGPDPVHSRRQLHPTWHCSGIQPGTGPSSLGIICQWFTRSYHSLIRWWDLWWCIYALIIITSSISIIHLTWYHNDNFTAFIRLHTNHKWKTYENNKMWHRVHLKLPQLELRKHGISSAEQDKGNQPTSLQVLPTSHWLVGQILVYHALPNRSTSIVSIDQQ